MRTSTGSSSGAFVAMMIVLMAFSGRVSIADESIRDEDYWRGVIANDFAPPTDEQLPTLLDELSGYLASNDPVLRDDIAYAVLTQWLYIKKIVPVELRRKLTSDWILNLRRSIGERDTDTVVRRSFSALMLSVIVALDNEAPYLERGEFNALLDAAIDYLGDEQDTRGFDAEMGWLHSVAHTADLLKFLARSRHLEVRDQSLILAAIAEKLGALDHVLDRGEDERLARVVLSLVARLDFDLPAFQSFLRMLQPLPLEGLPTPRELAINQNRRHLAVSLYAVLATDSRDLESRRQATDMLLTFLKTIM